MGCVNVCVGKGWSHAWEVPNLPTQRPPCPPESHLQGTLGIQCIGLLTAFHFREPLELGSRKLVRGRSPGGATKMWASPPLLGTGTYLGWVAQIEGLVEAEVDKAQQGCVKLSEGGHDPVVHISRVLGTWGGGEVSRVGMEGKPLALWRQGRG